MGIIPTSDEDQLQRFDLIDPEEAPAGTTPGKGQGFCEYLVAIIMGLE